MGGSGTAADTDRWLGQEGYTSHPFCGSVYLRQATSWHPIKRILNDTAMEEKDNHAPTEADNEGSGRSFAAQDIDQGDALRDAFDDLECLLCKERLPSSSSSGAITEALPPSPKETKREEYASSSWGGGVVLALGFGSDYEPATDNNDKQKKKMKDARKDRNPAKKHRLRESRNLDIRIEDVSAFDFEPNPGPSAPAVFVPPKRKRGRPPKYRDMVAEVMEGAGVETTVVVGVAADADLAPPHEMKRRRKRACRKHGKMDYCHECHSGVCPHCWEYRAQNLHRHIGGCPQNPNVKKSVVRGKGGKFERKRDDSLERQEVEETAATAFPTPNRNTIAEVWAASLCDEAEATEKEQAPAQASTIEEAGGADTGFRWEGDEQDQAPTVEEGPREPDNNLCGEKRDAEDQAPDPLPRPPLTEEERDARRERKRIRKERKEERRKKKEKQKELEAQTQMQTQTLAVEAEDVGEETFHPHSAVNKTVHTDLALVQTMQNWEIVRDVTDAYCRSVGKEMPAAYWTALYRRTVTFKVDDFVGCGKRDRLCAGIDGAYDNIGAMAKRPRLCEATVTTGVRDIWGDSDD